MQFGGEAKDQMRKTIAEVGWDDSRTGTPGQKPVVCLYFTKD